MAKNTVTIHVTAKDDATKSLNKTRSAVDKLKSAAKIAFVGAAGGAGVFGAAAVKSAVDFESSMAEVQTLIPQMDDGTFLQLSDDLRDMSKEFGFATSETIPALYQAISAGVPTENVIDFMSTAAKAAIGGATDLETAVDGITSGVNAYGSENISAAETADIMFSAVKDGKTTFEELAGTLSTALPHAAAIGVEFADVAASIAEMTSQGVKTSVAASGIRQFFTEASKTGTDLDKAIRDLTGKSFSELIKDGETSAGILQLVRDSMPDQEFRDLFGSVEAAGAALQITGNQFDGFEESLANAEESAGNLDAAFVTMSDTAKFKLDQSLAQLRDIMLGVGIKLLPLFVKGIGLVEGAMMRVPPTVELLRSKFDELVNSEFADYLIDAQGILVEFSEVAAAAFNEHLMPAIENVISIGETMVDDFKTHALPLLKALAEWELAHIHGQLDVLGNILGKLAGVIQAVTGFLSSNVELIYVAIGAFAALKLGALLYTAAMLAMHAPVIAMTAAQAALAAVLALNPFTLIVIGIAVAIAAGILIIKNWDEITQAAGVLWETVKKVWGDIKDTITGKLEDIINWIDDRWSDIGNLIKKPFEILDADGLFGLFPAMIGGMAAFLKAWLDFVKDTVNFFKDQFEKLPELVKNVFNALIDLWSSWGNGIFFGFGKSIIEFIIDGIKSMLPSITNIIKDIGSAIKNALGGITGWHPWGGSGNDAVEANGLASGGIVKARPGGTLALLGEGGRDEAVIPLGRNGASGIGTTTVVNNYITIDGIVTDPVETGQQIADVLNRASIITGPLVMSTAVE